MNTGYTACDGAECNQDVTKIAGEYLNVKRQNEESFRFLFESEKPEIPQVHPHTGEVCRFSLRNIHTEKFSEFLKDFTRDPFSEFPCVWFGTSEDSIVKTGFIDDDDFSSTTHRIRGLSFTDFIFIQS